ncbi:MAG: RNA polymerase subunit sigma-70 [Clostridia bacterium]|nr:RNA polymerase subunit sigma-70 [Clostridia bacterium]
MTETDKAKITDLRLRGNGYRAIATTLGLSLDTVRKFCKRRGLAGYAKAVKLNHEAMLSDGVLCLNCKKPIEQPSVGRHKKFCSNKCRLQWWNRTAQKSGGKSKQDIVSPCCGKHFLVYGSANRKYCSHECYIKIRFGGKCDDRTH